MMGETDESDREKELLEELRLVRAERDKFEHAWNAAMNVLGSVVGQYCACFGGREGYLASMGSVEFVDAMTLLEKADRIEITSISDGGKHVTGRWK